MFKKVLHIALVLAFCPRAFGQTIEYRGVCVGINDYHGLADSLYYSIADAEGIRTTLEHYQSWLDANITRLEDAQATKSAILNNCSAMPKNSSNMDLFYYSGHAWIYGLYCYDGVSLSPSDLQGAFSIFNQYTTWLDACESGVFANTMTKGVILAACRDTEYADEWDALGHSVFSYYLIQGLTNGAAAGANGLLSAQGLYNYASPLTTTYESNLGYSMHPQLKDNYGSSLYLNLNIYVPQQYSTVLFALAASHSGQTVVVTGSQTLTSNGSVPSGVTLVMQSGATVNLNGYSIVSAGGTITVQSGATVSGARLQNGNTIVGLYPTIQATLNAATGNQTIYIPSGTYTENVSAVNKSYLTITGQGPNNTIINGNLTFNNCSHLWLSSSFSCNSVTAYYINLGNFFSQVDGGGITLYNCSGFDQSGIVDFCSTGLSAVSSNGEVMSGAYYISNNVSILSTTGGNVMVYQSSVCQSITYDLSAQHHSHIDAYQGSYSNGIPRYYTYQSSTVSLFPPFGYCGSMAKKTSTPDVPDLLPANYQIQSGDPVDVEFSRIDSSYFSLIRTIKRNSTMDGMSNAGQLHNEYLGVLNDFRSFIQNNPQSPLARVALTTAANSFRIFGDYDKMKSFLTEIMTSSKLVQLKDAARNFMIDYYRETKDFASAINAADALIQDCKSDSELAPDAMLRKGLILRYDQNTPAEAVNCFSAIVKNYPGTEVARLAENQLQSLGGKADESADSTGLAASQGMILANCPNPFNPTTQINYQLPTAAKVSLKVYDILGRLVATIVDGVIDAGHHAAKFDGSKLSSGVYFARAEIHPLDGSKPLMMTRKLLLAK